MDTATPEELNIALMAELRAEMAAQGLSASALAEKTGISRPSLMRYLGGHRQMSVVTLLDILRVLGVDNIEFMSRVTRRADR